MNNKSKLAWEKRARIFKNKREAVMQQSLPKLLNEYVHKLHTEEILKYLPEDKCLCLDIGCGYGRLASEIVDKNKRAKVLGIDVSETFVGLFNKKIRGRGKAFVGDLKKLPFQSNSFDLVYCVVTLMYLEERNDQKKAISEMFRVLKPQGVAVIIEPNFAGDNIIKFFGLLPFILRIVLRRKKVETFGITFPWRRIDELIKDSGGKFIEKRGYTFFTIFFLPILALSKVSQKLSIIALSIVYRLDKSFPFARFSHIITYVVLKQSL